MQPAASAIVLASLYALLGAGYVLIYRASRVLNLGQGEMMMLSGYALYAAAATVSSAWPVAVALAIAASCLAGALIYLLLMRPMAGHPVFAAVLVTVSLGILLRAGVVLIYTERIRHPLELMELTNAPHKLPFGVVLSTFDLLTVAAAVLLFTGLFLFLRFSRIGIQMRAAGERALLAAQRGINFHFVFALSWALAAFAGALAGMLYANNVRLDPGLGVLGLKAFAVAMVGGLDSLAGVIPGALIVAGVEVACIRYGDPLLSEIAPFLCLLATLLIRPWGLFGTVEELERV
jgi:branched-chain amino acid transport system permease protein